MSHIDRLTLFLGDRDNRSLSSARAADGLPAADRIRAAMQLWQQGVSAEQIDGRAEDLRRERRTRAAKENERQIKVSVILGAATHQALALARIRDGIPAAERIRAALHQWQQDPQFRVAVDELAGELRRERFANRPAAGSPAAPPDLTVTTS